VQAFRVKIRRTAELIDALGEFVHVFSLVDCVLGELFFDALAIDADRRNGVHRVPQYANDLRGQRRLQEIDGLFYAALVILRDGAAFHVFSRATAQFSDVRDKGLGNSVHGVLRSNVLGLVLLSPAAIARNVTTSQAFLMPRKINAIVQAANAKSACVGTIARSIAASSVTAYVTIGAIAYQNQSSEVGVYACRMRIMRKRTRTAYTTPYSPVSANIMLGPRSEFQGALNIADTRSAVQKCTTVGELNVSTPSRAWYSARSCPATSVITTNIKPVKAPDDEPVIT
jgi:hypothetical protein